MSYDNDSPLADDIIASEDPVEAMENLARRGIFVYDPAFYTRMHPGTSGQLNLKPPFWGGIAIVLDHCGDLTVDSYVFIDDFAIVYTHMHDPISELKFWEAVPVPKKIGSFVYIGPRVTVASSCKEIGEGAVILPGSHVNVDVPAWTVWEGNPARQINDREKDEEKLNDLRKLFERDETDTDTPGSPEPEL